MSTRQEGRMMADSRKVLTVSYGAFSCRLEGFDDPVAAMQEVVAHFRALAAEDHAFGKIAPDEDDIPRLLAQMPHEAHVEPGHDGATLVIDSAEGHAAGPQQRTQAAPGEEPGAGNAAEGAPDDWAEDEAQPEDLGKAASDAAPAEIEVAGPEGRVEAGPDSASGADNAAPAEDEAEVEAEARAQSGDAAAGDAAAGDAAAGDAAGPTIKAQPEAEAGAAPEAVEGVLDGNEGGTAAPDTPTPETLSPETPFPETPFPETPFRETPRADPASNALAGEGPAPMPWQQPLTAATARPAFQKWAPEAQPGASAGMAGGPHLTDPTAHPALQESDSADAPCAPADAPASATPDPADAAPAPVTDAAQDAQANTGLAHPAGAVLEVPEGPKQDDAPQPDTERGAGPAAPTPEGQTMAGPSDTPAKAGAEAAPQGPAPMILTAGQETEPEEQPAAPTPEGQSAAGPSDTPAKAGAEAAPEGPFSERPAPARTEAAASAPMILSAAQVVPSEVRPEGPAPMVLTAAQHAANTAAANTAAAKTALDATPAEPGPTPLPERLPTLVLARAQRTDLARPRSAVPLPPPPLR